MPFKDPIQRKAMKSRAWYLKHKELVIQQKEKWRLNNPLKYQAQRYREKCKRAGITPDPTFTKFNQVMSTEKRCINCGQYQPFDQFYMSKGKPTARCKTCYSVGYYGSKGRKKVKKASKEVIVKKTPPKPIYVPNWSTFEGQCDAIKNGVPLPDQYKDSFFDELNEKVKQRYHTILETPEELNRKYKETHFAKKLMKNI